MMARCRLVFAIVIAAILAAASWVEGVEAFDGEKQLYEAAKK